MTRIHLLLLSSAFALTACGSLLDGEFPNTADTTADATADATADTTADTTTADTTTADTTTADTTTTDTTPPPPPDFDRIPLGDPGAHQALALPTGSLAFSASGPTVLRWNGKLWSPFGRPLDGALVHAIAATPTHVLVAGPAGQVALRPTDGLTPWQVLPDAPDVDLHAAYLRSPTDLFVAGDRSTLAHWDGSTWTTLFSRDRGTLYALAEDPAHPDNDHLYAVGSGGQLVTKPGLTWTSQAIAAQSATLRAFTVAADGTLIAAGTGPTLTQRRPNDITWFGQTTADPSARDLFALARGADAIPRAFGAQGLVLSWERGGWNLTPPASLAARTQDIVAAQAAPAAPRTIALLRQGGAITFDGTTWSPMPTRPDGKLHALARAPDGTLWAAGSFGLLMQRGPQGWTTLPTPTQATLTSLTFASDGRLWIAGDSGTIFTRAPGAATLTALTAPAPLDLTSVVANDTHAFVCGRGGTLWQLTPDTIVPIATHTSADLYAVTLGGDQALWAAGAFGTLLRQAPGAPSATLFPTGVGAALYGLAPTPDGVLTVGDHGTILTANATAATPQFELPGAFLYAIATAADGRAVAVGDAGLILTRTATTPWVSERAASPQASFSAAIIDGSTVLIGGMANGQHLEQRRNPLANP